MMIPDGSCIFTDRLPYSVLVACGTAMLLCAFGMGVPAHAQGTAPGSEAGRLFMDHFDREEYGQGATPYNSAVVQDHRGVTYVANDAGVLAYDDVRWRLFPTANNSQVVSLAPGPGHRLYVGAQEELGVLAPDSLGRLRYVSLLDRTPPAARPIRDVHSTLASSEGAYFLTDDHLLFWSREKEHMQSWAATGTFHRAFRVGGVLYVHQRGVGLMHLDAETLRVVPGGDALADMDVQALLPLPSGEGLLVGTRQNGLFRLTRGTLTPHSSPASALLRRHRLTDGVHLPDGRYAWATARSGVLLAGPDGRLRRIIDEAAGLPTEQVNALYVGRQGGLWMALSEGLARLALETPLTSFTEKDGLEGAVTALARHRDRFYAATTDNVYRLNAPTEAGRVPAFEAVQELERACFTLEPTRTGLLAGCDGGLYRIREGRARRVRSGETVYELHRSPQTPSRLFAGLHSGVMLLERTGTNWEAVGPLPGLNKEVRFLVSPRDSVLWIGTDHAGVYRFPLPADTLAAPAEVGSFAGAVSYVFGLESAPLVTTRGGVFGYADGRFRPDTLLRAALPFSNPHVSRLAEDETGRVWLFDWDATRAGVLHPASDGGYTWDAAPLARLPRTPIYAIDPEPDGTVWLGGTEGLFRYASSALEASSSATSPAPSRALLRRVTVGDSLLVGGAGEASSFVLPHDHRALRLTFAAPHYGGAEATRYQTRLDGFDESWSSWSTETAATYTSLPPGQYTFRVRARDATGLFDRPASLTFRVRPPWYRTGWAYGLYVLAGLGLVFGLVRLRTRHLEARRRRLERTVARRTAEVERQKREIERQAERLREMDELKSRLFANLSHEFRTPLTLILGPLESAQAGAYGDVPAPLRRQHTIMRRNAHRLLRLINQMLDLARLEAGELSLDPHPGDLAVFVRRLVRAFQPLAERQRLTLDAHLPESPFVRVFDADKLEKVLTNLLSNAVKFTPSGGSVTVTLRETDDERTEIAVRDTGPGIPEADRAHLFDRFHQSRKHSGSTSSHEGTGIGLALAHELTALHGGTLSVDSTVGEGSTFTVQLPLSKAGDRESEDVEDASFPSSPVLPQEPPAEKQERNEPEDSEAIDDDRPVVLVVDDNADVRTYLHSILTPDYRVVDAADGRDGLDAARRALPDSIVADVMMPRMDGLAMSRALKDEPMTAGIPVILLTARAEPEDEVEGLATGADAYVTKPFEAEVLRAQVDTLIEGRHRLRRLIRDGHFAPDAHADETRSELERRARSVIDEHLSEESFSVDDLADALAMSRSTLYRRLQEASEYTPADLLRTVRLERAAALLRDGAGTVSEVAYAVGFTSLSAFSHAFRRHFGRAPSDL